MIREANAILLVVSGLGLLGWGLAEPDRALLALPIAVGGLVGVNEDDIWRRG